MKRVWKGFLVLIIICLVLGAVLLAAGLITGGSPETLRVHGDVPAYFESLAAELAGLWEVFR